eukprot:gene9819-biopygen22758
MIFVSVGLHTYLEVRPTSIAQENSGSPGLQATFGLGWRGHGAGRLAWVTPLQLSLAAQPSPARSSSRASPRRASRDSGSLWSLGDPRISRDSGSAGSSALVSHGSWRAGTVLARLWRVRNPSSPKRCWNRPGTPRALTGQRRRNCTPEDYGAGVRRRRPGSKGSGDPGIRGAANGGGGGGAARRVHVLLPQAVVIPTAIGWFPCFTVFQSGIARRRSHYRVL